MRTLIVGCFAASVFLAFNPSVHASPGNLASPAAQSRGDAVRIAQADKPAAGEATETKKKPAKKPVRREPTKKEMDDVRRHVPPEYHHYLPKGR